MQYHDWRSFHVEILAVIDVQVALLPVPAVVHDFVHFIVEVRRVKVFGRYQMTPVQSVGGVHVDVVGSHVGRKCHVGVQKFVDVRWHRFRRVDDVAAYQIATSNEWHVPQSPETDESNSAVQN